MDRRTQKTGMIMTKKKLENEDDGNPEQSAAYLKRE
jgi:hypothetical protein